MAISSQIRTGVSSRLKSQSKPAVAFLFLFVVFAFWYYEGDNFTDSNIPGTYIADKSGKSDELLLRPDHTYEQKATLHGQQTEASGMWRLMGNADAHIVFEGSFLNAPPAAVGRDDHFAFGMFENLFGYLTLTLQSDETPLTFHKKHSFF